MQVVLYNQKFCLHTCAEAKSTLLTCCVHNSIPNQPPHSRSAGDSWRFKHTLSLKILLGFLSLVRNIQVFQIAAESCERGWIEITSTKRTKPSVHFRTKLTEAFTPGGPQCKGPLHD
jgi:hypothetical protein